MIIDARDKGMRTDRDNRAAMEAACAAAHAEGKTLWIPPGTYPLSGLVDLTGLGGLTIEGTPGRSVLSYPSDDAAIVGTGVLSDSMARSALLVRDAGGVAIEGMTFQGRESSDLNVNVGKAIYAREATDLAIDRCTARFGGGLLTQDATPTDVGLRVTRCTILGSRHALNPGCRSVISACRFEVPPTADYDRKSNTLGSSHGVYIYAGRDGISVEGCHFRGIRVDGVKFSGTSLPIRDAIVRGCHFDDCGGGVLFGADATDDEEHSGLVVSGNTFTNCATNRPGWNTGAAVTVLGSRGVIVSGNTFLYDRDSLGAPGGCYAISVARYGDAAPPVEGVDVSGNMIQVRLGAGHASRPDAVIGAGIGLEAIGRGGDGLGSVRVAGNTVAGCTIGIQAINCVGLSIEENTFVNCVVAVKTYNNAAPIVRRNRIVPGPNTTNDARYRSSGDVGGIFADNL